jgi:hypothetical protein
MNGWGAVFRQLGLKCLNLRIQLFNLQLEGLHIVLKNRKHSVRKWFKFLKLYTTIVISNKFTRKNLI